MARAAPAALALALLAVVAPAGSGGAGEHAGEAAGPALHALTYRSCPGIEPAAFGVVPVHVRCANGPVDVGSSVAHGFLFPPPGFSGRITSRLVGEAGDVRTFTCATNWAQNAPVVGLVSPSISCGGSGSFPFGQRVRQECTVEGIAPLGGGGSGAASAGAWACYLGA